MKFCKDCVHFTLTDNNNPSLAICANKASKLDPVTGRFFNDQPHPFCRSERVDVIGSCGTTAQFFKEVPNV